MAEPVWLLRLPAARAHPLQSFRVDGRPEFIVDQFVEQKGSKEKSGRRGFFFFGTGE
jgi:hypothetical protein